MTEGLFCVDCGKATDPTIQGSCRECFVRRTPLLEVADTIDVELCAHCNARHVGHHWQDTEQGASLSWAREDAVRGSVRVHARVESPFLQIDETPEDEKHFRTRVVLEGAVEGVPVHDEASTLVRQKRGVCDRCSRMQGDYFAAIIQLRATDRDVSDDEMERSHGIVTDELTRQLASGNRFAFLSKDGPIHGGWDYYVGDIEAARQVCRVLKHRLGASVQETAKLVGRREGDDVYRVTFLVRIRLFAAGDFALGPGKRPVLVLSVQHGRAACIDLLGHGKTRIPEGGLKRLGGPELVEDAILVSQDQADLQVLDPVTLNTVDVPRPEAFSSQEETVSVVRIDERLYLVP